MLLSETRDICLGNEICPKKWGGGGGKGEFCQWNRRKPKTFPQKFYSNHHRNRGVKNKGFISEKEPRQRFPDRKNSVINTAGLRNDGYHPAGLITFLLLFTFYAESFSWPQASKLSFLKIIIFSGHSSCEADPASPLADLCSSQGTKSSRKLLAVAPECCDNTFCGAVTVSASPQPSTVRTSLRQMDVFRLYSSLAILGCQSNPVENCQTA